MKQFRNPTPADQFDYLLRVYFGSDPDQLSCCIRRAYRDLNRTIHGLANVAEGEKLRGCASAVVRAFLSGLAEAPDLDQTGFDSRHQATCEELGSTYSAVGFADFRIGQAQKWLNMALKYIFTFGEERLPGYSGVFQLAHIPLDNIILEKLRVYGVPQLSTRWSRISDYDEYLGIQRWVRSKFPGSAPLAVEFALWQNAGDASADEDSFDPAEPPDSDRA